MTRSLNEISGLVGKAARGAGLPLGIAEDLAGAVPSCCDGAKVVAALQALGRHLAAPAVLTALIAALDRVEALGETVVWTGDLDPLLTALIRHRGTICWTGQGDGTALSRDVPAPVARPVPQDIPADLWTNLEAMGARTYVPASDASRIAGAGTRLSDND
jgi:hypothetical protein